MGMGAVDRSACGGNRATSRCIATMIQHEACVLLMFKVEPRRKKILRCGKALNFKIEKEETE